MKAFLLVLLLSSAAACGPRRVEVQTAPAPASEVSLRVTNNTASAVNVYVTTGGNDLYVAQVPANSTTLSPVTGVAAGSTVTIKAVSVDGAQTYTRENVQLTGTYDWQVP